MQEAGGSCQTWERDVVYFFYQTGEEGPGAKEEEKILDFKGSESHAKEMYGVFFSVNG